EAEVAKKAWWLTENGPVVERYSTFEDDGDLPYGSGCGGVVSILMERRGTAQALLEALYRAWHAREPLAIATVLEGPSIGTHELAGPTVALLKSGVHSWRAELQVLAHDAFVDRKA